MSSHKTRYLVGIYDEEHVLMHAISHVRHEGVNIKEVYSPYPIHGMEAALGYKGSRLSRAAFLFGVTGFLCASSMILFMMNIDWPMIVGGKSTLPYPDFVPVSFELTVLFASFGMVGTFLIVSNLLPGVEAKIIDPRSTDDKFVLALDIDANKKSVEEISILLKAQGASEVYEKEFEF